MTKPTFGALKEGQEFRTVTGQRVWQKIYPVRNCYEIKRYPMWNALSQINLDNEGAVVYSTCVYGYFAPDFDRLMVIEKEDGISTTKPKRICRDCRQEKPTEMFLPTGTLCFLCKESRAERSKEKQRTQSRERYQRDPAYRERAKKQNKATYLHRYHTDEAFREAAKQTGRDYYAHKKE